VSKTGKPTYAEVKAVVQGNEKRNAAQAKTRAAIQKEAYRKYMDELIAFFKTGS